MILLCFLYISIYLSSPFLLISSSVLILSSGIIFLLSVNTFSISCSAHMLAMKSCFCLPEIFYFTLIYKEIAASYRILFRLCFLLAQSSFTIFWIATLLFSKGQFSVFMSIIRWWQVIFYVSTFSTVHLWNRSPIETCLRVLNSESSLSLWLLHLDSVLENLLEPI